MANVLLFLADGFEEVEALTTVDLLRRAGIIVTMVSVEDSKIVTGAHGIKVIADILFKEIKSEADMLILPGGPGTKKLRAHEGLKQLIFKYHKKGIYIAAICAAPTVLGLHGLLQGKQATCYPGCEDMLIGAVIKEQRVVVDGKVITSRGAGTSVDFALAIIEILCNNEVRLKIAEAILWKG